MKPAQLPVTEEGWIALEREAADAVMVRRRLRGKPAIRTMEEKDQVEDEEEAEKKRRVKILRVTEEEMRRMVEDDAELALEELQILSKLKKLAVMPNEEEEVLQTKIVSPREVAENWEEWLPAVRSEVESLLNEKEAFREVFPEELHKLKEDAEKKGKGIEHIPSKLVFTRKSGPDGGKKKVWWVACGKLEPRREEEDNFSSGADTSALGILVWVAARGPWCATTLDVRTAFLNAKMVQSEDEDLLLVKPLYLFTEKKFMGKDVLYKPEKAIYGFRRSPKLWGLTRDETINGFNIEGEHEGRSMNFVLEPLQSEPNLWKLQNADDEGDLTVYGLLMTYVDDLLIAAPEPLMLAVQNRIQSTWTTSGPEPVSSTPARFLGMEISKLCNTETKRDVWMLTQRSYTLDLVQKENENVKPKKIPLSRDQSAMEPKEESPLIEKVRSAQKAVGEALWLTTRARPDIMYVVSSMRSAVTRAPEAVMLAGTQLKGYLATTAAEGLKFDVEENELPALTVYTDASFAPGSEEFHGSFIVLLGSSPIFWRSGRQGFVTLSTAEAELTEIIEGMIAGESIHVILAELFPEVPKLVKTDNMPALAILTGDGGSWRTRHLELRAAFARQAVAAAEWAVQHVPGESMVADIGTKPLTAARLNFLKNLMGMGKSCDPNENEVKIEAKEKEEKKDNRLVNKELKKRLAQTTQVLQLITLAATLSVSKAEEGEKADADRSFSFGIIVIYTLLVIFLTLVAQRLLSLLDVSVQRAEFVTRQCVFRAQPGSHAEDAVVENEPSRRDRLEPLVEESPTATGGEDPEHVNPQPVQHDAPRSNRNAPQPDPEPQSPRPTSSQSTDLTNALAALRVHDASMPDYEAEWREIDQEEGLVREELTQALPGDPRLGPLQHQTLRRRALMPALPELPF